MSKSLSLCTVPWITYKAIPTLVSPPLLSLLYLSSFFTFPILPHLPPLYFLLLLSHLFSSLIPLLLLLPLPCSSFPIPSPSSSPPFLVLFPSPYSVFFIFFFILLFLFLVVQKFLWHWNILFWLEVHYRLKVLKGGSIKLENKECKCIRKPLKCTRLTKASPFQKLYDQQGVLKRGDCPTYWDTLKLYRELQYRNFHELFMSGLQ